MRLRIEVECKGLNAIHERLGSIEHLLEQGKRRDIEIMKTAKELLDAVQQTDSVVDGIEVMFATLRADLKEAVANAGGGPEQQAAIDAGFEKVTTQRERLVKALTTDSSGAPLPPEGGMGGM